MRFFENFGKNISTLNEAKGIWKGENAVGEGKSTENTKLKIAMLGDGDIIGTTEKKPGKSRLLVA